MVEIFRTDIQDADQAASILGMLFIYFPECKTNFDLEDCDKILRVEGCFDPAEIENMLMNEGIVCVKID